ncbi:Uncharacterised protein [Mycobacteroides abscessus subsp. abscessus]|nr:Uncharacterised protein [Mycobacteroides abscessus subsp. abscessus]
MSSVSATGKVGSSRPAITRIGVVMRPNSSR